MKTTSTMDERVWAVLSHLSALALGMGILLPVIGWSEQRRKSKYAAFQCLQALGYQSLGFTVWLLASMLAVIAYLVLLVIMSFQAERSGRSFDPFAGAGTALALTVFLGLFGLYMLVPIVAAVACALGRDFRYPLMGKRLAAYLGYEQADTEWMIEEHEDRWVASMGHFAVLIMVWGMLAPVAAWVLQGKRSLFLKFQSVQTLVYQAATVVLYLGAGVIYMSGFMVLLATVGFEGGPQETGPAGMLGLIIFFISMLFTLLIVLIVPLLHILGQWAGYRVLKGDAYRYPIVGRLVEKWMKNRPKTAAVDGGLNMEGQPS